MIQAIAWDGSNRRIISKNIPNAVSLANNDLFIMDRAFSSVGRFSFKIFIFHSFIFKDYAYK